MKSSTRGAGPEARPPKVLSLAPAGRTLDTSHCGIRPAYRSLIIQRKAFAQPSLLSATIVVVSLGSKEEGTVGSLETYCRSTENPTPVPQRRMNIALSKSVGFSTGVYAQLYRQVLSRSIAPPAVIRPRILGMTSSPKIASSREIRRSWLASASHVSFLIGPRTTFSTYRSTVSPHVSRRCSSSSQRL